MPGGLSSGENQKIFDSPPLLYLWNSFFASFIQNIRDFLFLLSLLVSSAFFLAHCISSIERVEAHGLGRRDTTTAKNATFMAV